jgi:hypothetical protein
MEAIDYSGLALSNFNRSHPDVTIIRSQLEKLRHADFADQLTHLHSAATHHRRATSRFCMIFSMPGARIASQRPPWFMA